MEGLLARTINIIDRPHTVPTSNGPGCKRVLDKPQSPPVNGGNSNFRHNHDVFALRVGYNIFNLLLRIKATIGLTIADIRIKIAILNRLFAEAADLRQFWMFDFNAIFDPQLDANGKCSSCTRPFDQEAF